MPRTAIFIKSHLWGESIEKFVEKIYNEVYNSNDDDNIIDFYLLIQDTVLQDTLFKIFYDEFINCKNKNNNNDIIKIYSEETIRNMYPNGVINMWMSNHIIELWFYNNFAKEYDYIWSIEYDARIVGDSSYFWKLNITDDLIIPNDIIKVHKTNIWYNKIHESFKENEKYHVDLQIHRTSKRFLDKLHELFTKGINGQDEIIYGSVCMKYNFSYNYTVLNKKINGKWSPFSKYSNYNTQIINSINDNNIYIFHPVKPFDIPIIKKNIIKPRIINTFIKK